ncbi:hypothetical protein BDR04DRAFT_1160960 [Suillus decipiens]|nr:hypothetical protein BDR04DRAFT_1160960 [Suillus decipiens]
MTMKAAQRWPSGLRDGTCYLLKSGRSIAVIAFVNLVLPLERIHIPVERGEGPLAGGRGLSRVDMHKELNVAKGNAKMKAWWERKKNFDGPVLLMKHELNAVTASAATATVMRLLEIILFKKESCTHTNLEQMSSICQDEITCWGSYNQYPTHPNN